MFYFLIFFAFLTAIFFPEKNNFGKSGAQYCNLVVFFYVSLRLKHLIVHNDSKCQGIVGLQTGWGQAVFKTFLLGFFVWEKIFFFFFFFWKTIFFLFCTKSIGGSVNEKVKNKLLCFFSSTSSDWVHTN